MKKEKYNINDIATYLKDNGIQPSVQRIKIFEYLVKYKSHPTVDEIYSNLFRKIPTLSKTTVYNTLNLFIKKGIIISLTIEDNELRYDIKGEPHAHFKCIKCGKLIDVEPNCNLFKKKNVCGNRIIEYHIYFKGICKECLKK